VFCNLFNVREAHSKTFGPPSKLSTEPSSCHTVWKGKRSPRRRVYPGCSVHAAV
jgi:hypothetical protein